MEHHGAALRAVTGDDGLARRIAAGWRTGGLEVRLQAMLGFAEKLTLRPQSMAATDLDPLREVGLDDRGILEVVEITAYFNFVNRLADGLGVTREPSG